MAKTQALGSNITARMEGTKLIIEVDATENLGLSSSGKMREIANSGGFQVLRLEGLPDQDKIYKLNLYFGTKV